jgi:small-conductance mechanosensitive channel
VNVQVWLESAWDYSLPRLLESAGWIGLAAVLYVAVRWTMRRVERAAEKRTSNRLDDWAARLVRQLLLLSVVFFALWRVALSWGLVTAASVVIAAWIIGLAFPISNFLASLLQVLAAHMAPRTETSLDDTALPLFNKIIRGVLIAGAALVALETIGVQVGPLLAGAGVAGLALSLAAKDTLSNLIAGVQLILDRPFKVGDRVELWTVPKEYGTWGDVVEIGLRATKIRTPDNLIVIVPNNEIMRRDIINYTASGEDIRLRIPIGISYDADATLAKELILRALGEIPGIKSSPEPVVIVRSFGASSVDLEARPWIDDARRRRAIGDQVTERVKELFEEHGVEIPYPKRDIYVRSTADRGPEGGGTGDPFQGDSKPAGRDPGEPGPGEGSTKGP